MKLCAKLFAISVLVVTTHCYADSLLISGSISASGVVEPYAYAANVPYTTQLVLTGATPGLGAQLSSADYYARAAFGNLGVAFTAGAMTPGNGCPSVCSDAASGGLKAISIDRLIVTGASASDFLRLNVFVDGSLTQNNSEGSSAFVRYFVTSNNVDLFLRYLSCGASDYNCGGLLDVYATFLVPLQALQGGGEYASLIQTMDFQFECIGSSGFPCNQSAHFANSAKVGGATVVDGNGNVLPGTTISSDSGFDYTQPISATVTVTPEPETFLLLLTGVASTLSPALKYRKR